MEKHIRKITGSDYEKFNKIANSAFEGLNADKWLENHIEETTKENLYGVFKDKNLLAGMRTFDFEMNYSSTPIRVGGVGMLAVDMLHKKEKNAYQLLQYFLNLNSDAKVNLVMLNPFKVSFYKKMGFGIGTKNYQFYLDPNEFPNYKEKSHLVELTVDERGQILDCYNRVYSRTHGMTKRFPFERELNRPFWFGRVIGYVIEGEVKGYFVYSIKEKDLHIHELFFESPDVIREFSTFLNSQSDQIKRVIINSNFDEILHFLDSPESGETTMVDFTSSPDYKHIANVGTGIMYRIINCSGFFEELKESNHIFNPSITISVKLAIEDDLFPINSLPFILDIKGGRIVDIKEDGPADVELRMNIAVFSSLVMGVDNANSYLKWGLMEISDVSYIKVINSLFQTDSKPMITKAF
ncbi:GNAT family N-acetyltransferase [Halobacillus amylolyticus]|uniref:GNAT family N-acetyltransferase n=1 Tax=Halobacillus amylolyticus TaxID=2932259 RepID=A0ABY4HDM2_9BACI|nr:GNAT family N-acetyltransferase [Halobacillus amylolyticus]UOR12824.1 GNAT family N-acetyltransferase [Halobacillus amylolyticus]